MRAFDNIDEKGGKGRRKEKGREEGGGKKDHLKWASVKSLTLVRESFIHELYFSAPLWLLSVCAVCGHLFCV
jgi:hypothetical protein